MADQFSRSVECGLRLAKRIYYGRDGSVEAPNLQPAMEKSPSSRREAFLPAAPMVYAMISEPSTVDNPDIMSYQPYVHGRCDPPALIPLHMHEIAMEVDCYLDTAFVTVSGTWRVHCVAAARNCDCRVAIPMGEQGSLLGVEVDAGKSYKTRLITEEELKDMDKVLKAKDAGFLMPHICTLKVPQVYGGSIFSLKAHWSQKLSYHDGDCCLHIPFSFPEYVIPVGKKLLRSEKIQLNIYFGNGTEVLCRAASHPLKEPSREAGDICGGLFLQSPPLHGFDQRELFCLYISPGNNPGMKVFRKEVVFVIDISGSMNGTPLEIVKDSIFTALSKFDGQDYFNIVAFNGDSYLFSSSLERVTKQSVENAAHWFDQKLVVEGGTNILLPLNQAIEMFSKTHGAIPILFLVTDGAVEDERHICSVLEDRLSDRQSLCPRIYTFGIGSYCNHYFLQMLAHIGSGYYDAAYDLETIKSKLERLVIRASSVILADVIVGPCDHLELYPSKIPDLVSGCPLVLCGRSSGKLPVSLEAKGVLADMSTFVMKLKLQDSKGIPLEKVLARRQMDVLTSQAWLLKSRQIERKVGEMSRASGFPSAYGCMVLVENDEGKQTRSGSGVAWVQGVGVGFGDMVATVKNSPPGREVVESGGALMRAAGNCCGKVADQVCCMCCIQGLNWVSNQCAISFSQLCTSLACFGCLSCCFDLWVSCDDCCG